VAGAVAGSIGTGFLSGCVASWMLDQVDEPSRNGDKKTLFCMLGESIPLFSLRAATRTLRQLFHKCQS